MLLTNISFINSIFHLATENNGAVGPIPTEFGNLESVEMMWLRKFVKK